jgi:hypothetical protein
MSCRFAEFSEHNLQLLMFGQTDAAEQEDVRLCPGVLPAFRAGEFGFARKLHFRALAGGGRTASGAEIRWLPDERKLCA